MLIYYLSVYIHIYISYLGNAEGLYGDYAGISYIGLI